MWWKPIGLSWTDRRIGGCATNYSNWRTVRMLPLFVPEEGVTVVDPSGEGKGY